MPPLVNVPKRIFTLPIHFNGSPVSMAMATWKSLLFFFFNEAHILLLKFKKKSIRGKYGGRCDCDLGAVSLLLLTHLSIH